MKGLSGEIDSIRDQTSLVALLSGHHRTYQTIGKPYLYVSASDVDDYNFPCLTILEEVMKILGTDLFRRTNRSREVIKPFCTEGRRHDDVMGASSVFSIDQATRSCIVCMSCIHRE